MINYHTINSKKVKLFSQGRPSIPTAGQLLLKNKASIELALASIMQPL